MKELTFTPSQRQTYDGILAFINGGESSIACLQGYAGTGKTTLVAALVNELATWKKIAVMAPTNKAVGVLHEKIGEVPGVEFGSLHSFLGLRLKESDDGKHVCLPEGMPTIHNFDLAIIDECSMVSAQLFQSAIQLKRNCRVLFVGDPAQLPPVEDGSDSPTFNHIKTAWRMTEVVRQAKDNPIIAASIMVRQAIENADRTQISQLAASFPPPPAAAGVIHGGINTIVDILISEAQAGRDCRALAWRNDTVDAINTRVHDAIFPGHDAPFHAGETVIAHSEFKSVRELDFQPARVFTSEELTVRHISKGDHPNFYGVAAWRMELLRDTGATVIAYVPVDKHAMRNKIDALWRDFRAAKANGRPNDAARKKDAAWSLINAFAQIKHAYAMTAHKSQGSTFDTALIHWQDLQCQRSDYEFNRLLYVAMTRAAKHLAIVTQ